MLLFNVSFSVVLLPLGWGPSFILARHLQHRAEDGGEREETADGTRIPCEDRGWTPRNLPGRAGTETDGKGQAGSEGVWGWGESRVVAMMGGWTGKSGTEGIKRESRGGRGKDGGWKYTGADPSWLRGESHGVTRGGSNNVASGGTGSCLGLSNKALIFSCLCTRVLFASYFCVCLMQRHKIASLEKATRCHRARDVSYSSSMCLRRVEVDFLH